MKKLFSLTMVCLLLLGSVFPSYAYSVGEKTSIDGWELSAKRFAAKCNGTDYVALAESILSELGMSEIYIAQLPESKKIEIANAVSIQKVTDYAKVTEDAVEVPLTEQAYLQAEQEIDAAQSSGIQLYAQGDSWHEPGNDSLFKKDLYIYETKNAPKGTYGIIVSYSWKNLPLHYHGEDIISVSGEHLVFARNSFGMSMNYTYTQTISANITTHHEDYYYDMNNLKKEGCLKQEAYGISFQFNLPNNIYSIQASRVYTNADFLMMVSGAIDTPRTEVRFNVYGKYFHQHLGLGSLGVSVNINGASVSVSPKLCYTPYDIQTREQLVFIP